MTTAASAPTVLIILDGWGHREERKDNAVAHANTPTFDRLFAQVPNSLISGSGMDVGLPEGQMGNSEVGHMNLGAGRVVYQDFTRVSKSISDGDFFENTTLTGAVDGAVSQNNAVHIMGLLSPGGVHSHEDHIVAMIELAQQRGASQVYVHAFLDGRDVPPRSAEPSLQRFDKLLRDAGIGQVASIIGRYYAMDRDQRWQRVESAYRLLTEGVAAFTAQNAVSALQAAYNRDESDEFVQATAINNAHGEAIKISDGDALIFMNFRADRAREISRSFVEADFAEFARPATPKLSSFVTLTQYSVDIDAPCAYAPEQLHNVLGAYVAEQGLKQLRIAETEKYAHVTFFFSGGQEALFAGEQRELIPSPDVATYDLQPEMNAAIVTDKMVAAITGGEFDLIVCNYANGDMVGHTGNFAAAVKAVETLDGCIARIETALKQVGGQCLITADHGNCEQMLDYDSGQAHTAHTCELVPLLYVGEQNITLQAQGGTLSDIAPSLLSLMGLPQPAEMTGTSLIIKA